MDSKVVLVIAKLSKKEAKSKFQEQEHRKKTVSCDWASTI